MRVHSILFGFIVMFSSLLLAQEADIPDLIAPPTPQPAMESAAPSARQQAIISSIRGRDAGTLERMREDMTIQLRDLSRVMSQIDPRDTRFADSLKTEQTELIEQIKAIDAQMKLAATQGNSMGVQDPALPRDEAAPNPFAQGMRTSPPPIGTGVPPYSPDRDFENPATSPGIRNADDFLRQQTTETIKNLRELGLNDLADQEQKRLDALSRQPNQPSNQILPPGSMLPSPRPTLPRDETPIQNNFSPAAPRPVWNSQSSTEVAELKETITSLKTQIEQMRQDMKAIETQLRLLNQNILLKGSE